MDLAELRAYRELLYFFLLGDIKVRYKQTVIGAGKSTLLKTAPRVNVEYTNL